MLGLRPRHKVRAPKRAAGAFASRDRRLSGLGEAQGPQSVQVEREVEPGCVGKMPSLRPPRKKSASR